MMGYIGKCSICNNTGRYPNEIYGFSFIWRCECSLGNRLCSYLPRRESKRVIKEEEKLLVLYGKDMLKSKIEKTISMISTEKQMRYSAQGLIELNTRGNDEK